MLDDSCLEMGPTEMQGFIDKYAHQGSAYVPVCLPHSIHREAILQMWILP
jgi:hypothetical protein